MRAFGSWFSRVLRTLGDLLAMFGLTLLGEFGCSFRALLLWALGFSGCFFEGRCLALNISLAIYII